jgi:5-methyltetrahydropteroyltriglutamate--homocysteine methyltransferase
MRHSTDAILTSHAGSLPRPDELIELNKARQSGEDESFDEAGFQRELTDAVRDVVARQVAAGVTVPGDGEYGKAMGHKVNYGAWWSYSFSRLSGLDPHGPGLYEMPVVRSKPGEVHLTSFADRRDRLNFQAAYDDPTSGVAPGRGGITWPRCVGPVSYMGTTRSPPTSRTSKPRSRRQT